ncbi:helix-turn-helix domain-containing protein [Flavobacterium dauae]|uniref:helix-turn-helix domain-containing protein n=1 Tax=Flavobacterium dauae TaxID=1563479 RepID=UPI00101B2396|nr:helix-turn-helix domain-containing protein [Flavobacterium dauae]WLD23676.1 helix-turn-helix domain-containing protein [Flavobacterium dauae]
METIGTKITQLRKQKALSQENLAELSKVNVRTIQRIENNETTPRGATLKLICDALEVTPDEIVNFEKFQDNTFLIWLHLSVMLGYVLPLGNIILPLILWLSNKNKIDYVNEQGKNILNFQILYSVFTFTVMFIGIFGKITHKSLYVNFETIVVILFVCGMINFFLPIINAVRISKGTVKNFYPTIIRFIR